MLAGHVESPHRGGHLIPPGSKLLGLCALAFLTNSACGKDDTGSQDSGPAGPGDNISLEIAQGSIHVNNTQLGEFPGWVGVANLDDDDQNGVADFEQGGVSGDNDLTEAWLNTRGRQVKLRLSGTTSGIRIYQGGQAILGQGASQEALIEGSEELVKLSLEFSDFLVAGSLSLSDVERESSFSLDLTSAPLILNHHLQPAEEVMAMKVQYQGYSSKKMVDAYKEKLGNSRFITVDGNTYGGDVWVQDEFEFGYFNAPGVHMNFIFDTLRNGQEGPGQGLDNFPEDQYEGPDWVIDWWGKGRASSLDYGGNLEVSPPVEVDGVNYPYGRIYYGGAEGYMPKKQTRAALDAMQIQKPFLTDSTWLCVGHVDEFSSTVPDPTAPKGFRFIISDTHAGWAMIDSMDPSIELPRWAPGGFAGHNIDTVGEIQSDTALHALNREIQEILDAQLEIFKRELNLNEEDIIYMPSLFEEPNGCGSYVAALIPGMVNLIVAEEKNGDPAVFLADPFLRTETSSQSSDPMIAKVRDLLPDSLNLHFLDDWDVYHMGLGEVHCGSNVKREATTEWWNDGAHLLHIEEGGE
jgi:protein-arginine deiminase